MIRKTFDSFKKGFHALLDPNALRTPEEKHLKKAELLGMKKFPIKEVIDFMGSLNSIPDRRRKQELISFVEEILIEARQAGMTEAIMLLFRNTADPEIRDAAFRIASLMLDESLIPTLLILLKSPRKAFRLAAIQMLEKLPLETVKTRLSSELLKGGWADWTDPLEFLYNIAPDLIVAPCRKAIEIGNEEDKIQAIKLLTLHKTHEAIRSMESAADDESVKIRVLIAKSFTKVGGPIAIRCLVKLSNDSKPDVVLAALDGLRDLKSPAGIAAVIACMKHENLTIRNHALNAIGEIGTGDEVHLLVGALKDQDIRIRQGALEALINLSQNSDTDIPKFISILMSDPDVNVRRAAAQILGQVDAPGLFETMFEYLRDEDWWVRETIAETLAKIKDERIYPAAVELMSNNDPSLRRYAIEILVGMNDPRAIHPLITMLKDPDWWVRERAINALGILGNSKIVPILSNLLGIKELAYATAEALGQIGDKSATPFLIKAMPDSDVETKLVIMNSLEKLDAREAIAIIEKYLSDPVREVRTHAKEVLTRLRVDTQQLSDISDRWWEYQEFSLLDTLLMEVKYRNGSDLFLVSQNQPLARVKGELLPLAKEILTEDQIFTMVSQILNPDQERMFLEKHDLDFSYELTGEGRFRGSMFKHSHGFNLVFRLLPDAIPILDDLNLPPSVKNIAKIHHGLVLVTGPASCGKSTTLAALINELNEHYSYHIITIEDPIEYVHSRKNSLITQREVGRHTLSFAKALRAALREDPDVILIGELRDLESISMALTAAETGHLVFATVHSVSSTKTIDRILDVFPVSQQGQIRTLLSECLKYILGQQLVPRRDETGNVVAMEIMVNTPAIASLIRDNKIMQIPSLITSGLQHGMVTMDQSLMNYLKEGIISPDEAYARAEDKAMFESYLKES